MMLLRPSTSVLSAIPLLLTSAAAQTFSNCNPLTQGGCPADSALGKSVNIDFTQGASDSFTAQGSPSYDSNGVSFTIAQSGDSPQLTSKWYLMFGRVDAVIKAAPGAGIVSSFLLQSDDLDEIDWEWLGADDGQVQSNYFGKGQTTTYNRGAFHPAAGNQEGFKTYTIEWTAEQIVWQIDGQTVRVLTPDTAEANQYPQTPCQIKVGAWSGGDPSNAPGVVQWAGGPTDYSQGPFTMQVKSITAADYSTGTQYTYSGSSGNWQDIQATGGKVNSQGGTQVDSSAPAVTSSSSGQPIPFAGTQGESSTWVTPSVYPWVPYATTLSVAASSASNYPGLPSGWTVSDSGKVIPPSSAAATSPPAHSASSPQASAPAAPASSGQYEAVTTYNQQGFATVVTVPVGFSTMARSFDDQGFPITAAPAVRPTTTPSSAAMALDQKAAQSSQTLAPPAASGSPSSAAAAVLRAPAASSLALLWAWWLVMLGAGGWLVVPCIVL